jgi:hypothetical protein
MATFDHAKQRRASLGLHDYDIVTLFFQANDIIEADGYWDWGFWQRGLKTHEANKDPVGKMRN